MSHEDDGPLTPAPTIRDLGPPIDLVNADTEPPTDPAPDPVLVALVDVLTELGKVKDELRLSRANDELSRSALSNKVDAAIAESRAAHAAAVTATDRADEIMGVVSASHRLLKGEITDHLIRVEAAGDETNGKFGKVADFQGEQISTLFQMQHSHASKPADEAHSVYTNGNGVAAEE